MDAPLVVSLLCFFCCSCNKIHYTSAGILSNPDQLRHLQPNTNLNRRSFLFSEFHHTLTDAYKVNILNQHNYYRNFTASGMATNQPLSTNMNEVVWDFGLEIVAQYYSSQCNHQHNPSRITQLDRVQDFVSWTYDIQDITLGESIYIGNHDDLSDAITTGMDSFFEEHLDFDYWSIDCAEDAKWGTCDHYKQLVSSNTRYIGCGMSRCDVIQIDGSYYYDAINFVCNYYPSFVPHSVPYHYEDGKAICSHCDSDRICGKYIKNMNTSFDGLCSGCMSSSYRYCLDSSDLCSVYKDECGSSSTLRNLCKTSCGVCDALGIDGNIGDKCCSNGIDDTLKCPVIEMEDGIGSQSEDGHDDGDGDSIQVVGGGGITTLVNQSESDSSTDHDMTTTYALISEFETTNTASVVRLYVNVLLLVGCLIF